jgi:hypothetical protein
VPTPRRDQTTATCRNRADDLRYTKAGRAPSFPDGNLAIVCKRCLRCCPVACGHATDPAWQHRGGDTCDAGAVEPGIGPRASFSDGQPLWADHFATECYRPLLPGCEATHEIDPVSVGYIYPKHQSPILIEAHHGALPSGRTSRSTTSLNCTNRLARRRGRLHRELSATRRRRRRIDSSAGACATAFLNDPPTAITRSEVGSTSGPRRTAIGNVPCSCSVGAGSLSFQRLLWINTEQTASWVRGQAAGLQQNSDPLERGPVLAAGVHPPSRSQRSACHNPYPLV